MNRLFIVIFVLVVAPAHAQPKSYDEMLSAVRETHIADSLVLDSTTVGNHRLDSFTVKRWFNAIIGTGANKLKNRSYYLIGKITSSLTFDVLMLVEEKRKGDSSGIRVVYLVTMKKNGDYIASLRTAVSGTRKKSDYNIVSCLYPDLRVNVDSRISTNEEVFEDVTHYKITNGGRFLIYSNE